jgi:transposase-like protein
MSRKRYTPEQIIGKLREAEVALAQGETTGQVCRTLGIAEQTFYRWRREYGGLKIEQATWLEAGTKVAIITISEKIDTVKKRQGDGLLVLTANL